MNALLFMLPGDGGPIPLASAVAEVT